MEEPTRRQRFKNWAERNSEVIFGAFLVSVYAVTTIGIDKIAKYKLPAHADIWKTDVGDQAMFITSRDGTLTRLDYYPPQTETEV